MIHVVAMPHNGIKIVNGRDARPGESYLEVFLGFILTTSTTTWPTAENSWFSLDVTLYPYNVPG
jgi:hypothetical protein